MAGERKHGLKRGEHCACSQGTRRFLDSAIALLLLGVEVAQILGAHCGRNLEGGESTSGSPANILLSVRHITHQLPPRMETPMKTTGFTALAALTLLVVSPGLANAGCPIAALLGAVGTAVRSVCWADPGWCVTARLSTTGSQFRVSLGELSRPATSRARTELHARRRESSLSAFLFIYLPRREL
jgi:hypothetical protein